LASQKIEKQSEPAGNPPTPSELAEKTIDYAEAPGIFGI
jgi:hypothetical protein